MYTIDVCTTTKRFSDVPNGTRIVNYQISIVHIPPKSNNSFEPMYSKTRAKFRSPITIAKEMIFIPSDTGDIFVHNLYNGSFIHRFVCPPQYVNGTYNRAAIKGGVSAVNDRIVVYCGS